MTEIRDIREGDHDAWRRLFADYGVFYETTFDDRVLDGVWAWLMDAESEVCAVVATSAVTSADTSSATSAANAAANSDGSSTGTSTGTGTRARSGTTGSDQVVGFAHYRRLPDTFTAGPAWFLDDLYVQPEHRGAGAATALIDAVAERAASDGGGTLRWITSADNATAQRVYDRIATRMSWVTYERET